MILSAAFGNGMSSGPVRRVSRQDIQLVQNLIERCLQLYMSPKEVVDTLEAQAKIEPDFTELVWQKLQEENVEFFRAYYTRLVLKQQIAEFNRLLDQQAQLMQLHSTTVESIPTSNGTQNSALSTLPISSNGSHIHATPKHLSCYTAEQTPVRLRPENMQHRVDSNLSNVFNNGGSSLGANMHAVLDMSAHGNRINGPPSMLSAQNSDIGLMQGMNGSMMIKTAPGYSSFSPYLFGADANILQARQTVGDASASLFTNVEANTHSVNEAIVDGDTSSFGFLGQIPRNFSLSDLTFPQSSAGDDILESYCRSAFLPTDNENILGRREQVDNNRLDSISESLSYEDFDNE